MLAEEYRSLTVKTSIKTIETMLERANALKPFNQATGILDNGCGPGPVMDHLIRIYGSQIPKNAPLIGSDFSGGMIKAAQDHKEREVAKDPASPWARVELKVQDAMDLKEMPSVSVSHVTAGWVYFMLPDPQKALAESLRILQPDGTLVVSSWEGSQWLDVMLSLGEVLPDRPMPSLPATWQTIEGVEGELKKAGFRNVKGEKVSVTMDFQSRGSFVEMMCTKMPHMIALLKTTTEEQVKQYKELAKQRMQDMCPDEPGTLHGVALVAVGQK